MTENVIYLTKYCFIFIRITYLTYNRVVVFDQGGLKQLLNLLGLALGARFFIFKILKNVLLVLYVLLPMWSESGSSPGNEVGFQHLPIFSPT